MRGWYALTVPQSTSSVRAHATSAHLETLEALSMASAPSEAMSCESNDKKDES